MTIVMTQINENRGQGGRYDMPGLLSVLSHILSFCRANVALHWEEEDALAKETFTNVSELSLYLSQNMLTNSAYYQDTLICICIAFAVRTV
jgi:hypothetical protein